MRTTLTIDEDIATKLDERRRLSGKSFKLVVNETLRDGLTCKKSFKALPRFKVQARPLGLRDGLSYDNIGELLEMAER
ncbi:MAG: DUF2191 domain-containing protein [Deltaproteobacteria bacterium]|nr:DUF2191 domain-containing protein [Deltaproteobacteria bacterium]